MRTVETVHPLRPEEIAAVTTLLSSVRDARGFDPISENKVIGLSTASMSSTGILMVDDDTLVGYGHLEHTAGGFAAEVAVDPSRDSATSQEIASTLIARIVDEAGKAGGGSLTLFMPDPSPDDLAIATCTGFVTERELLVLGRPVTQNDRSLATPEGLEPFRPGVDEDAWMALNARAFSWHPEQGTWSRDDLLDREHQTWFDPAGVLCLWVDDRLAGTCWTKIADETPSEGEIYVMSVDPEYQGRGFGRLLLTAGIAYLAERSCSHVMLYVEGDNDSALALYRAFGFTNLRRTIVARTTVTASSR